MRTDDKLVRHTVAERRGDATKMPWERARVDHARRVASVFRGQADRLDAAAQGIQDEARRDQLKDTATRLRAYAKDVQATPTRAQKIAKLMQQQRGYDAGRMTVDRERD